MMTEESFFETADETSFDEAFEILDASFPDTEKRSYEGQKALLEQPDYKLLISVREGKRRRHRKPNIQGIF